MALVSLHICILLFFALSFRCLMDNFLISSLMSSFHLFPSLPHRLNFFPSTANRPNICDSDPFHSYYATHPSQSLGFYHYFYAGSIGKNIYLLVVLFYMLHLRIFPQFWHFSENLPFTYFSGMLVFFSVCAPCTLLTLSTS